MFHALLTQHLAGSFQSPVLGCLEKDTPPSFQIIKTKKTQQSQSFRYRLGGTGGGKKASSPFALCFTVWFVSDTHFLLLLSCLQLNFVLIGDRASVAPLVSEALRACLPHERCMRSPLQLGETEREPKPRAQIPPAVPRQGRGGPGCVLAAQVSVSLPKHEASKLLFLLPPDSAEGSLSHAASQHDQSPGKGQAFLQEPRSASAPPAHGTSRNPLSR